LNENPIKAVFKAYSLRIQSVFRAYSLRIQSVFTPGFGRNKDGGEAKRWGEQKMFGLIRIF